MSRSTALRLRVLQCALLGSRRERGHQHARVAQERGAWTWTHTCIQKGVDRKNVETRKSLTQVRLGYCRIGHGHFQ
ncbi:hypothetical protein JG688_00010127 [Phytophthora aleatoria]|uniref:Uncharacterized protein n=1 Tax=Phytophthora aleatoria TaxID=2496075 RepID=A0A8J5M3J8_9STRA|nr:hypothetical protein JG688_00010127 [Phytophthora aleatoria]